jgi:PiT family inorganic phosphate transporter
LRDGGSGDDRQRRRPGRRHRHGHGAASRLGIPLSTTHTINTAIMGVGATRRLCAVRWGVGREIVTAWVLTFPACAAIAALTVLLLRLIF